MNSPAPHSFSGPKLDNRVSVSTERSKELEGRLKEMEIWKERCLFLDGKKEISQWMDFNVAEYTDILFAIQTGDIRIDYNEELFNSTDSSIEKTVFNEQKKGSLKQMNDFKESLQSAKTYWHTNFEQIFGLLNETINITAMILISSPNTVVSETRQSNSNYQLLHQQCRELFAASDILIRANQSLSKISLDSIANLCNIRIFKNSKISRSALSMFYRAEEVRLLLQSKSNQPGESLITQHLDSLSKLKEKVQDPHGMDGLKRDTNSLICQAIGSRYMEAISEQLDSIGGILGEYEMKCWKYTDILKGLQRAVGNIKSSQDLLQVFDAIERVTGEFSRNVRILSEGHSTIKGLGDMEDIIKKLELLHIRIQNRLIENIRYNYQSSHESDLNPALSIEEAIKQTHADRKIFQAIYYALIRILSDEKDVFDDTLMKGILASPKKIASIDWKKYEVSLHSSVKERLSEYHKHPFYKEMEETLKKAIIIYIKKVEKYIKDFSDPSWGTRENKETGNEKEKEAERETLASLLESIKKRIAEKKKK